jgi:hypothetical protein
MRTCPSANSLDRALRAVVLAGVLLTSAAAQADHSVFTFRLDSASVVGNASGGSGCAEGFGGGLNGWAALQGDPTASGGFVVFQAPGEPSSQLGAIYDLTLEGETLQAPAACTLSTTGGDATLTTEWVNDFPNLPGNSYGHQLAYATSASTVESIAVTLRYFDAAVAVELGVDPGLYVSQAKFFFDLTPPDVVVLSAPAQIQSALITPSQLTGATGQRIYLRLSYEAGSATVVASYSLDGGSTYQTPFTPVDTGYGILSVPGLFQVKVSDFRAPTDPNGFLYQLDRGQVAGNASGGSGCAEEFDGGLNGWTPLNGNPTALGGFVDFENPGAIVDVLQTVYDLALERVDLQSAATCALAVGGGNATLTTEWVNHLPSEPGGFYGHQLAYAISPTAVEAITLYVRNPDAAVAAELGISSGLQVGLDRLLLDMTDPQHVVLAAPIVSQVASLSEAQLAGATGQRIHLRLEYDEGASTVTGAYSLDGEATYQSPFTPVTSQFGALSVPGLFIATAGAVNTPTPVPTLSPMGISLLTGLLIGGSLATRRFGRQKPGRRRCQGSAD